MKQMMRVALCGLFLGFILFMSIGANHEKAELISWSNDPEPELNYISQTPTGAIMMAGDDSMYLNASDPSDFDTKTTTDTGSSCEGLPQIDFIQDSVDASYWSVYYNPGASFMLQQLTVEPVPPIRWTWTSGDGDYGSYTSIGGLFFVSDGREVNDPRRDPPKAFNPNVLTRKAIPDTMDAVVRTDFLYPHSTGLGCFMAGSSPSTHIGLRVWHPIENETLPDCIFDGMQAVERVRLVTTNGTPYDNMYNDLRQLMLSANGVTTAGPTMTPPNPSNYMNDNHGAGQQALLLKIMEDAQADTVTLWQTWHILDGGWDSHNYWPIEDPWPGIPDPLPPESHEPNRRHAIGLINNGGISFSHIHFIVFKKYEDYPSLGNVFLRVWKDGVTCQCQGPSW